MSKSPKTEQSPVDGTTVRVLEIRGERVVLDRDVAELFGVETRTLNQQVTRNKEKFGDDFAYRLTEEEVANLKSQNVISSGEWGGSRYQPVVFTEHGVVMAATLLKTPRAIAASRLVIRSFVATRRNLAISKQRHGVAKSADQLVLPLEFQTEIIKKVGQAIGHLLDAMINPEEIKKARAEARGVLAESVKSLKELLKKPTLDNEKTAAEIRKLMAEAENIEVETDGKRIQNEERQLALLAKKLSLILEAQHFAQTGSAEGFIELLSGFDEQKRLPKK